MKIILLVCTMLTGNAQIQKLSGSRVSIEMIKAGVLANILKRDVGLFYNENRAKRTKVERV